MASANEHKAKVRLARSMMTPADIRSHTSIWDSPAWLNRREARTGIAGGRRKPLPAYIRRAMRFVDLPKQAEQKQSLIERARNLFKGNKVQSRQKVV